jgi:hypothetical protein
MYKNGFKFVSPIDKRGEIPLPCLEYIAKALGFSRRKK